MLVFKPVNLAESRSIPINTFSLYVNKTHNMENKPIPIAYNTSFHLVSNGSPIIMAVISVSKG